MGGRRFTWVGQEGSKLSKLDRFLLGGVMWVCLLTSRLEIYCLMEFSILLCLVGVVY